MDVAALDRAQTADLMIALARERATEEREPAILTSVNGQVLSLAARNPAFLELCETADLVSADGQPMVIASRLLASLQLPERVATTDLFHDVAARASDARMSFYLLGATAEENSRAVANVKARYGGIRIAGAHHGYFPPREERDMALRIAATKPDVLWVSLGVPREQEFAIRRRRELKGVGVVKTSGGLLNFLSGTNRRAPVTMQRAGLEWLFRVLLEPRRLLGRYVGTNLHAAYLLTFRTGAPSRTSR